MEFRQKCLYMGIGFLFTSLGWLFATLTVVDAEKESDEEEITQFDTIACSRFYLLNENEEAVMAMEVMPKKGPTFIIVDTAFREDGTESRKHLSLYSDGLAVYNENGDKVIGATVIDEGGVLFVRNQQNQPTWAVEANKRPPLPRPQ